MIWIGWDSREADAFAVAARSMRARMSARIPIRGLVPATLEEIGMLYRPTRRRDGRMYDEISDAPMSTEHANARFLVPLIAQSDWALFTDGDVLARGDVCRLFERADPKYAVMVVKHRHEPPEGSRKMDGQVQTRYTRKNWSSVCLWNVDHPATRRLTVEMVNTLPGRDLHRFCWLEDDEIGDLGQEWNYLVGHTTREEVPDPKLVHFTEGTPSMPGYETCEFSSEWRRELRRWAETPVG